MQFSNPPEDSVLYNYYYAFNSAADFIIIITHAIQDPKNVSGSCDSYVIIVNHTKLVRPPLTCGCVALEN